VLGLAAMIGSGVFAVFAPAARQAGGWLPLAVLVACLAAALNARSITALETRCPGAGSGYVHCRMLLAPWAGRLAGVLLLAGMTSAAAVAGRVFADYVLPSDPLWVAVPVILVVGCLNGAGVRPTMRGAWVVACGVLAVLLVVVLFGLTTHATGIEPAIEPAVQPPPAKVGVTGVLAGAGLVFFAFIGYPGPAERTGAEARRAVPLTLLTAALGYLAVAAALLHSLGLAGLVDGPSALAAVVGADPALGVLVRVGAAAATVSVMLAVLVGASRTVVAMARRHDLPCWFTWTSPLGTPWRADLVGASAAVLIAVLAGTAAALAFSACCMLVYFALVNLAALRLPAAGGTVRISALGSLLCLVVASVLPRTQVLVTVAVLLIGSLLTAASAASARRAPGRRASRVPVDPAVPAGRPAGGQARPEPRTRCGKRRAGHR
jgi:basic amino acid/polyamine antiporter, APA family